MSDKYAEWTLPQIRDELWKRREKLSGRKFELVERLEAYDRNFGFEKSSLELHHDFKMDIPSSTLYKDLNSDVFVPNVTIAGVNDFWSKSHTELCPKAEKLYTAGFIDYVRTSTKGHMFYVKACCRAEMKKYVSYIIDISLDIDGAILECQCECAAGMGRNANCKHVRSVLDGLCVFSMYRKTSNFP